MKSTRSIVLAASLVTALPVHAISAGKVDQESAISLTTIASFGQTGLAQSFQQLADNITGAGIRLTNPIGADAKVTIELWSNLPNLGGSRLAGGTSDGIGGSWVDVFWGSVPITPETTYFLLFSGTPTSMGIGGDIRNPYPDGQTYANSGYIGFPNFDYAFRTYSEAAAVPEPASWLSMAGGLFALGALARRRR